MIPHWPGLVDASERKGWEDGLCCAPFSPILVEGMYPDADDAYNTAYWHGIAYGPVSWQEEAGE